METSSRQLEIKKPLMSLKVLLIIGSLNIYHHHHHPTPPRNLFPQAVHPSALSMYNERVVILWIQYPKCRMYLSNVIEMALISRNLCIPYLGSHLRD